MFNQFHQAVTPVIPHLLMSDADIIAEQTQKLREFSVEQIREFEQTHQEPAEQSPQRPGVSEVVHEAGVAESAAPKSDERPQPEARKPPATPGGVLHWASMLKVTEPQSATGGAAAGETESVAIRRGADRRSNEKTERRAFQKFFDGFAAPKPPAGLLRLPYHCPAAMAYSSNLLYQVPAIMMLAKENYQFPPLDDEHKRINFDYGSFKDFFDYINNNANADTVGKELQSYFPEYDTQATTMPKCVATMLEYLRTAKAKTANRPYDAPKNVFICTGKEPSEESGAGGPDSSGGPSQARREAAVLRNRLDEAADANEAAQREVEKLSAEATGRANIELERIWHEVGQGLDDDEEEVAPAAEAPEAAAAAAAEEKRAAERQKEIAAAQAEERAAAAAVAAAAAAAKAKAEKEQEQAAAAAAGAAEAKKKQEQAAAAAEAKKKQEQAAAEAAAAAKAAEAEEEQAARDRRAAAEAKEKALETKYKTVVTDLMKQYAASNFNFQNDRDKEEAMQLIVKWDSWLLTVIGGVDQFEKMMKTGGYTTFLGSLRQDVYAAYALGVVFGDNKAFLEEVENKQKSTYERFVADCDAILKEMGTFGRLLMPRVFGIGPLYTEAGKFVNKQVINALAKTLSSHHSPTDCRLQTFSKQWADYVKDASSRPDFRQFNKGLIGAQHGLPKLPPLVTDLIGRRLCLWIPAMIDQTLNMNTLNLDEIFNYLIVGMYAPSMIQIGDSGYTSAYRPFRMRTEGVDEDGSAIRSGDADECANYWIKHEMVEGWAQVAGRSNAIRLGFNKVSLMGPYQYQFVYPDGSDLKQRLFGRPLFKPDRDSQELFWGVAQSLPFKEMIQYMSSQVKQTDYPMLCAAVEVGLNDVIYARAKKEQSLLHGVRGVSEVPLYPIRIRCPQESAAEERTFAYIESQYEYTSFAAIDPDATSLYLTNSEDPITNEQYYELLKEYRLSGVKGNDQKFREYANAPAVEDIDFGVSPK